MSLTSKKEARDRSSRGRSKGVEWKPSLVTPSPSTSAAAASSSSSRRRIECVRGILLGRCLEDHVKSIEASRTSSTSGATTNQVSRASSYVESRIKNQVFRPSFYVGSRYQVCASASASLWAQCCPVKLGQSTLESGGVSVPSNLFGPSCPVLAVVPANLLGRCACESVGSSNPEVQVWAGCPEM
ncbi:hypothetical protein BCV69DRAFT_139244 [Microstroma glucosiphilum]|uniref:Uncharacterized protein n=1 Tax=Pseudomicrostroma glucosiphilum TaxID=1684307 RepID=A0A316UCZ0_9BASI|nr:hypothetical protein BCV69DRAFT_139244 [Pseudomicrostroma glucosiphilum]PWN22281.1 hypothetical protein BCV69DRAFT_139244 [Pseudomicrostroma glucosiphilum]